MLSIYCNAFSSLTASNLMSSACYIRPNPMSLDNSRASSPFDLAITEWSKRGSNQWTQRQSNKAFKVLLQRRELSFLGEYYIIGLMGIYLAYLIVKSNRHYTERIDISSRPTPPTSAPSSKSPMLLAPAFFRTWFVQNSTISLLSYIPCTLSHPLHARGIY